MTSVPVVKFKRLDHSDPMVALPAYETLWAAGADIRANLKDGYPIILTPSERALIPTGFAMEIPPGFEAQIRPRSGLAYKYGITCLNTPGTIDADYRGEVRVLLINHGSDPYTISHGDRIAQMVIAPLVQARFEEVDQLSDTPRGAGGFGSTGTA